MNLFPKSSYLTGKIKYQVHKIGDQTLYFLHGPCQVVYKVNVKPVCSVSLCVCVCVSVFLDSSLSLSLSLVPNPAKYPTSNYSSDH